MNLNCPTILYKNICSNASHVPLVFGEGPAIASLVSCSLSICGSILTILPYLLWRNIRTGIRRIITFLAVADLFTATGYILGNLNYYIYKHRSRHRFDNPTACERFDEFCAIQSYISSWSSYSSFWWTSILALYLYWTVVRGDMKRGDRYFPLYHILSWGSPIIVMLPLLATGSLGYSIVAAGGWCFIKDDQSNKVNGGTIVKILIGGKAFEIGTYIWVICAYGGIWCNVHKKKKLQYTGPVNAGISSLLQQVEKKLYLIPFAFILIRMWGTVQFIVSLVVFNAGYVQGRGCVPKQLYYTYYVLAILQSIGDGAQGWINSILYIFWSPKIRQKLIIEPLAACCYRIASQMSPTTNLPHTLSPVTSSPLSPKYGIQDKDPSIVERGTEPFKSDTDTLLETLSKDSQPD